MVLGAIEKVVLLLWKHCISLKRNACELFKSVAVSSVCLALIFFIRIFGTTSDHEGVKIYNKALSMETLNRQKLTGSGLKYHLAYSPKGQIPEEIVREAAANLQLTYSGHASSRAMENEISAQNYLAGVEFDWSMSKVKKYPNKLKYRIRFPSELRTSSADTWSTNILFPPLDPIGPRNKKDTDGGCPSGYFREGFLAVQHAIAVAFINQTAKSPDPLPKVFLQRYPYPEHISDEFISIAAYVVAVFIGFFYIFLLASLTKQILLEKQNQIKEVLKILDFTNGLQWTARFVIMFVPLFLLTVLIITLFTIKWKNGVAVFTYSSVSALLLLFTLFIIATIITCFMLSTFFFKAEIGLIMIQLILFVMFLPFMFLYANFDDSTSMARLGCSVFSPSAFGFAVQFIYALEATGEGFQWNNMFSKVNSENSLTIGYIIAVMCLSSVIQLLICLYIENIFPGQFGVPKKWNYPFTSCFCCGKHVSGRSHRSRDRSRHKNPNAFEVDPEGAKIGIEVIDLSKKYGKNKVVKHLSFNIYEDEITILLGHNGAGKTTTISMILGMLPPTSGTVIMNGSDIRTHPRKARGSMGFCPQHNILFDDLTVRQHLIFYSWLNGLKGAEIKAEATRFLEKLQFQEKADALPSELSGGMRRKLSVCAAFCGGTKVVLCDEPSSGMDPESRRSLWNLIQSEKSGRTILFTTHFMDEADVLGDRIAIMSGGKLKCYGTTFFLKKNLGSGYRLICVKLPNCDSSAVTRLLSKYIPDIKPEAEIGAELYYKLPESYAYSFESMFRSLEKHSEELLLNGYGVSIASLEDIFMKLGSDTSDDRKSARNRKLKKRALQSEDVESANTGDLYLDNEHLLSGNKLMHNQWRSMFLKKFFYTRRNIWILIFQNILPTLFLLGVMMSTNVDDMDLSPITIDLTQYQTTVTVLETTSNVKTGSLESKISKNYKSNINSYSSNHDLKQTGSRRFIDYILELGKTEQISINSHYIAAATVSDGKITAWLNNKPLHSAPLSLNLIHNAMAKTLIGPSASIVVTNDPLPYSSDSKSKFLNTGQNVGNYVAISLCFGLSVTISLYSKLPVEEHSNRAQLIQFVSGVGKITFWFSHFLWDLLCYTFTALLLIAVFVFFQKPGYSTFEELGLIFMFVMLFGCSMLLFVYFLSNFVSEVMSAVSTILTVSTFVGLFPFYMIGMFRHQYQWLYTVELFLLILPVYCFPHALHNLYVNYSVTSHCEYLREYLDQSFVCSLMAQCCDLQPYLAWKEPGVLRNVIFFIAGIIILTWLVIYVKYVVFKFSYILSSIFHKKQQLDDNADLDVDVKEEKEKVHNMSSSEISRHSLVVDSIVKVFRRKVAVNQVSVAVKHSECFGLLGVNGAGKTTTFKMLTGDEPMTSGEIYVKGWNMRTEMKNVYHEIGYCPQYDAILNDLTGRETLKIFALLRGIPENKVSQVSVELADAFNFMEHYDKKVTNYSGGNKRKLNAAIAIIGAPSVIYLDEPTTGMDPAARRQIWNVLSKVRDTGKTIILTSHSMDECEALCTRLTVMVNGQFMCLGSLQHLKNKFSKGFILKIKLKRDTGLKGSFGDKQIEEAKNFEKVMEFMEREFPNAVLKHRIQGILTFHIPVTDILWSKIFGTMERNKTSLNIDDYSINQTTLEEIFLQFAAKQRE